MKETKITDPDGKVTTVVEKNSGCGCGTAMWILLVLFLIGAPGAYFPTWLAVIAYLFEGLVVIAAIATRVRDNRWPWEVK